MSHTFKQWSPHLWVQQSDLYYTNSGVFAGQGRACLVDPAIFPHEIAAMTAFLAEQGLEPELLVLTHSHWDHIFGPEHFPGVKTVAQANYVGIVEEHGQTIRQVIADWERANNVQRDQPFIIPQPDQLFDERMAVDIGGLSLELIHTPGHAADQLAIYQAESGLLWASDILSDVEIPFISDNLTAFEQTLRHLATLDIGLLVPGHGHPTTDRQKIQARFAEDLAYLAELWARISLAVQAKKSVEETVRLCQNMSYRLPEQNRGPHQLNVESVYIELGGQADPKKVGWGKEWGAEDS